MNVNQFEHHHHYYYYQVLYHNCQGLFTVAIQLRTRLARLMAARAKRETKVYSAINNLLNGSDSGRLLLVGQD